MRPPDLPESLRPDLEQIGRQIDERIRTHPTVASVAVQYPGLDHSRTLAALALLCARFGTYDLTRVMHAAVAIELIRNATHVHNHVVYRAASERRQGLRQRDWDSNVALMVGDYMLAMSATEMARAPDARIIAYYSRAVMSVCEGELAPVRTAVPLADALEQYRTHADHVTARLFEVAAQAGAICCGAPDAALGLFGQIGQAIGMAMHIRADLEADDDHTPKDRQLAGHHLRVGMITLPLIYAADGNPRLAELAGAADLNDEQIAGVQAELRRTGGLERARTDAQGEIDRALALIAKLPEGSPRTDLEQFARSTAA